MPDLAALILAVEAMVLSCGGYLDDWLGGPAIKFGFRVQTSRMAGTSVCPTSATEQPDGPLVHMRSISEPTERALLALAIASWKENGRVHAAFVHELWARAPDGASMFADMAAETEHRRRLTDGRIERVGLRVPLIPRQDMRGWACCKPGGQVRQFGSSLCSDAYGGRSATPASPVNKLRPAQPVSRFARCPCTARRRCVAGFAA